MTPDWTPLTDALGAWSRAGRSIPIWWRDDDAIDVTPALDRLITLADQIGVPVHLAIVPAFAKSGLARRIDGAPVIPLVHGWRHENHAPPHEKKTEFGPHRPMPDRLAEIQTGYETLRALFGAPVADVFVPPWNRIDPALVACLPDIGIHRLSTYGSRTHDGAVTQINTHVDPIDWKGSRSLVDADRLLHSLADTLQARLSGTLDPDEPLGLLTHHLVHDDAIWHFTSDLLVRLCDGPVTLWRASEGHQNEPT